MLPLLPLGASTQSGTERDHVWVKVFMSHFREELQCSFPLLRLDARADSCAEGDYVWLRPNTLHLGEQLNGERPLMTSLKRTNGCIVGTHRGLHTALWHLRQQIHGLFQLLTFGARADRGIVSYDVWRKVVLEHEAENSQRLFPLLTPTTVTESCSIVHCGLRRVGLQVFENPQSFPPLLALGACTECGTLRGHSRLQATLPHLVQQVQSNLPLPAIRAGTQGGCEDVGVRFDPVLGVHQHIQCLLPRTSLPKVVDRGGKSLQVVHLAGVVIHKGLRREAQTRN
mmetsp:Transcript_55711/g.148562  ORF Transcript_55711/g.148562 Transcript_55711/m.148562 type:complete len:284 (+) Transcript_55711:1454-2305(+)